MIRDELFKALATLGPVGYSPLAPGTAGSAVSCLLYLLLRPGGPTLLLIISLMFGAGVLVSGRVERLLREKDSSCIVVDEFVGYLVAVFLIPFSVTNAVLAFLLFRFFDIIKPVPIRSVERRFPGGVGVMADDLLAGVYANLALRLILAVARG